MKSSWIFGVVFVRRNNSSMLPRNGELFLELAQVVGSGDGGGSKICEMCYYSNIS